MRLKLMRHLWGVTEGFDIAFPKLRAEGFEGIEWLVPQNVDEFGNLLKVHQFDFMAIVLTQGKTVAEHIAHLRESIERAQPLNPLQITCQPGQDSWSREQSEHFFSEALAIEQEYSIPIAFEIHRGRILFNPWVTRDMLLTFPEMRLCCDFSHWVCVCERLLDSEKDIIQLCAERCIHIHARVGWAESPQVTDPRAPEFLPYLEAHERWWDSVWDAQEARGIETSTLTPEYGPAPYQQVLPYTKMPIADVWEMSRWQAQRELERFSMRDKDKQ